MEMRANGWLPDRPDHRDAMYSQLRPQNRLMKAAMRPSAHYLKEDNFPQIYNQGAIGSCVGHGVAEACAYVIDFTHERTDGKKPSDYSRLFAYYNARQDKLNDTGAYIRDGVKAIAKHGICSEHFWPYVESNYAVKPPHEAYAAAAHRAKNVSYYRITNHTDRLDCLAQGFPIVYGMMLFDSFFRIGADGEVPMPQRHEAPQGGHCMLIIGYSMKKKAYYVRNSWGPGWASRGHCWVPFEYMDEHADDFWTIRRLER